MNRDNLRSNGHIVGSNGHLAQVERKPKRIDYPRLLALGRELLLAIGEDPEREGLLETPRRWADAWREFIKKNEKIHPGKAGGMKATTRLFCLISAFLLVKKIGILERTRITMVGCS